MKSEVSFIYEGKDLAFIHEGNHVTEDCGTAASGLSFWTVAFKTILT